MRGTTKYRRLGGIALILTAALLPACGTPSGTRTTAEDRVAAGSFAFWPPAPNEPRIQFVKSYQSMYDVSKREASALEKVVFGKEVEDSATISKPYGVAMRDGKIYVCDIRNRSLTVMDLRKKQTRLVGVTGQNRVRHPVAVAVGPDGSIYVADNELGAIVVFDKDERFSRLIEQEKLKPAGVAVHADRLYVTNTTSQLVEIFDARTGARLGSIGSVGDGDGQFRLPLGVAVDGAGDVYVADMMRCRVQKFAPDGRYITGFGQQGDFAGAFVRPKHLAVDSDGLVYVVDAGFQNVQMFDKDGRLLMHFGSSGTFPGAMDLPAGICVSSDSNDVVDGLVSPGFGVKNLVVVTNQMGNSRVALYARGGVKAGYTAADLRQNAVTIGSGTTQRSTDEVKFANPGTVAPGEGAEGTNAAPAAPAPKPEPGNKPARPAQPQEPPPEPRVMATPRGVGERC